MEANDKANDMAKMREALEKVRFYLPHFLQYMRLKRDDAEAGGYYERILEVVNAALSAPPRNCDVGSAREQTFRQSEYCKKSSMGKGCSQCPLKGTLDCRFDWMQMPYNEEGVKVE